MGAIKVVGRRALIGRGFLGSTLNKPGRFTDFYHSKNIHEMSGQYDLIVVAAPDAEKWRANSEPIADANSIDALCCALHEAQAERVVLLSTIDAGKPHAYGRHREELEGYVLAKFPGAAVLRLPALFGDGLKKNSLFDLLSGTAIANQFYQWYGTSCLWEDVKDAVPGLTCLYSAPLSMWAIAERLGLTDLINRPCDPQLDYNEKGPFTMTSEETLEDIVRWVLLSPAWTAGRSSHPSAWNGNHARGSAPMRPRLRLRGGEMTQREIEKCDLVCANCHRRRTHARRSA